MAEAQRSKVAPWRPRGAIAELAQRGRGLHEAMATLEHQERCARLLAAMPRARARSPTPTLIRAAKAPEPSAVAKPLVFRKTKRELQREQEALENERAAKRQRQQVEREGRVSERKAGANTEVVARRPTKCARVLFAATCRHYLHRSRAGRGRPRRRLQF